VGTQIADALTNDLLKTGELKVAVNPAAAEGGGGGGDPLLRLAQGTRSALVVAGTCDLRGAELEVQARVVDPWSGKGLYTAAPVRCPRGDPLSTLEPLRQRVTGAVVWNLDPKLMTFGKGYKPPRYDALVEYREGQADFGRDFAAADAHFVSSFALDPEFDLAWLMHLQRLDPEERAEELAAVEANLGRLGPAERLTVQWLRAEVDGRIVDALAAYRERATLTGTSPKNFNLGIGGYEVALNHPAAAIRALTSFPEDFGALHYSLDFMPADHLAEAYHLNRDYKRELEVAREGERRFPGVFSFHGHEAAALAALGRLDEIEQVIEASESVPAGSRISDPKIVMYAAYTELRAHGHREASLRMAERAVEACLRARPATETEDYQWGLLLPLLHSERWEEAKAIVDGLLARNPDDIELRGLAGTLAARLGDAAQARRIEAELAAFTKPYFYGGHTYLRACIAAQLGEKDRAVTLLRDAFGQGFQFSIHIHREIDLEPLWGYPPYEELMKPKG
jgi:tetratricopeptide (TPR) repeat protein